MYGVCGMYGVCEVCGVCGVFGVFGVFWGVGWGVKLKLLITPNTCVMLMHKVDSVSRKLKICTHSFLLDNVLGVSLTHGCVSACLDQ